MNRAFQVALTADFFDSAGQLKYRDIGLSLFDTSAAITHRPFAEHQPEILAAQLAGANAALVLTPRVTRATLAESHDLLAIARFGVGYDNVDVAACTEHDVVLCITRGAVDRSVAEATVGWMLALTHRLREKDRLVREARWHDRSQFMGWELRNRTLGIVGCGGIARELIRLLSTFNMRSPLVFDPYLDDAAAATLGVRQVALDELLASADFVSLHCPLTDETRGLIGSRELGLMRRSAVLINTARGGIVDEAALYQALVTGQIAGAALDCFATEPVVARPALADFDNVLLAPHCIAWTDELFTEIGRMACGSIVDVAHGRTPHSVVNPEVFARPSFQDKWQRLR